MRSTVGLLKEQFGEVEVLVPSLDIASDSAQWPNAAKDGVRFVRAYMPSPGRYWVQLQRLPVPFLKQANWPFPMPGWLREQLASVDAVLAVGGDNYSLDYRIPSPFMSVDKWAMDMGKPVVLWGASIGPFDREPLFVDTIAKHLSRMHFVAARESVSHDYVTRKLGLTNVIRMADPAFTLTREPVDLEPFWPTGENGVLGLNVSQLIERYRRAGQDIRAEVATFIRHAVTRQRLGVLLVPHVHALSGDAPAGDGTYMSPLLAQVADLGDSVKMMPHHFNAAQIKYVIGHLRFFMGARTHATIAALSSGVPTVSIAYSVKARGINRDLFGNENMVLQTPDLSAQTLQQSLEWLLREEGAVRELLKTRVGEFQGAARQAMTRLSEALVH